MTHTFSPKLKQSARPQAANSKSSMESHGGRTTAPQSQPAFGEQAIQPGVAAHPDCAAGIPAAALPLRLSQIPIHPGVPPATPRANGVPLDAGVRARYEYNLGKSLGNVRVHTDAQAAASADSLHAEAYTLGRDIVFGADRYRPGSPVGERLLAHELAHVAQQYSSTPTGSLHPMSRPGDPAEHAADYAAGMLLTGQPACL